MVHDRAQQDLRNGLLKFYTYKDFGLKQGVEELYQRQRNEISTGRGLADASLTGGH